MCQSFFIDIYVNSYKNVNRIVNIHGEYFALNNKFLLN